MSDNHRCSEQKQKDDGAGVDVVVSLGSNCGNRRENVREAIEWISGRLTHVRRSSIYETPPVGHNGSNYMNAVVTGRTHVGLSQFEKSLKDYEIACGRTPEARSAGLVPVDLDIVVADGKVLRPRDWNLGFFRIGWLEIESRTE